MAGLISQHKGFVAGIGGILLAASITAFFLGGASEEPNGQQIVENEPQNGYIIEEVPIEETRFPKPPSLVRYYSFPPEFHEDAQAVYKSNLAQIIGNLEKNSADFDSWINLGIYRKMVDDFEGAREAWEYAGAIRPQNLLSFGNLANLYAADIKDYAKAEANFLKALDNGPHEIYLYFQTAGFYRDILGDKKKALAVAERGLAANPGDEELIALRDSLR